MIKTESVLGKPFEEIRKKHELGTESPRKGLEWKALGTVPFRIA